MQTFQNINNEAQADRSKLKYIQGQLHLNPTDAIQQKRRRKLIKSLENLSIWMKYSYNKEVKQLGLDWEMITQKYFFQFLNTGN